MGGKKSKRGAKSPRNEDFSYSPEADEPLSDPEPEMKGRAFPWAALVIVVLLIAAGAYYYITYMAVPAEPEDIYGPQLEALNNEIYRAETTGAVETARTKVNSIKDELTGSYAKYLPLADAQLAVLDVIDLNLEYISEADDYAETGIDCSNDYESLISDMEGAETKLNQAKSKVNGYLYDEPNSTADLLLDKLDTVDTTGMAIFAGFMEGDYSKSCIEPETPTETYTTPLSKEDALDLVVNEVVGENNYYVYMIDEPLSSGDIVTFLRDEGDYNLTIEEETWFLYVDTEPFAPFAHDTKFVLVSVDDATYSVYNESYNPVINGIYYWSTYEERINQENIAYPENATVELVAGTTGVYESLLPYYALAKPGSSIPDGAPVPFADDLCCEGIGKKYALVVTGYDESMFKEDTKRLYAYLRGEGYSHADINYLTIKSTDANSDGVTTMDSVKNGLKYIADNAECCDEVFIYIAGHGGNVRHWEYKHKTTGEKKWIRNLGELTGGVANWEATGNIGNYHRVTINPRYTTSSGGVTTHHGSASGGRMMSYQFAWALDDIKSCYITFMYFSCYSGTAAPTLAGKGRTIITPTSSDKVAWGYPTNGSVFTNFWIKAQVDPGYKKEIDTNNDGKVGDKEAFEWAKKKTNDWADKTVSKEQKGTYTESTERCRCCHVICDEANDYLCKVIEGDGTDSEKCPKVGDYCGPVTTPPEEYHMECVGTICEQVPGAGEDTCTTDEDCRVEEPPEEEVPVCGDGTVTAPEECDYGTYGKNTCPEGQYCKDDCLCHDLETSVVCGDGKISSPEEDCDGGNVKTDICLEGYGCYICKCEPIEAVCGDGRIDPPEECDHGNTITNKCTTEGEVCQNCQCIPREEATHRECVDEACVEVQGYGEDQCYSDSQCEEPKHSVCVNDKCVEVEGEGTDQCMTDQDCEELPECGDEVVEGWEECEVDEDCLEEEICLSCLCFEVPAYCGDGEVDPGEECEDDGDCGTDGVCSGACTCVYPPDLDCDYICAEMGLPIILGHGYSNADECAAAASESPTSCYTTCIMSGFYRVDNIAGWDSCCCKKKEMFPCNAECTECPDCPSEYS